MQKMIVEQNKQGAISNKYNLFSPSETINPCKPSSTSKKSKMQIKLVFHHPNLLFLNSKKVRSRDQSSKEVGEILISNLKARSKHMMKSSANFRPYTSYQTEKVRAAHIRNSAINTPLAARVHTEQGLQVCGKSSCLTNELIRNPTPNISHFKATTTCNFSQFKADKDENLFRKMEEKSGLQKQQTWSKLLLQKSNRHAVRLNMYFSVEKKYLKYVSRC